MRYILFVGRLVERKGVKYLIEAFSKLEREDVNLFIVGTGIEKDNLIKYTLSLGLSRDQVIFYGYVDPEYLRYLYAMSDLFVLPAITDSKGDTEGLGIVLIEAMTYGLPVIASNVGGIPDVVIDGETGILVPEKDTDRLVEAINRVLDDSELRKKLIQRAKEHVKSKFTWDSIMNKLIGLYKGEL